jgi:hypothetical protein
LKYSTLWLTVRSRTCLAVWRPLHFARCSEPASIDFPLVPSFSRSLPRCLRRLRHRRRRRTYPSIECTAERAVAPMVFRKLRPPGKSGRQSPAPRPLCNSVAHERRAQVLRMPGEWRVGGILMPRRELEIRERCVFVIRLGATPRSPSWMSALYLYCIIIYREGAPFPDPRDKFSCTTGSTNHSFNRTFLTFKTKLIFL